VFNIVFMAGTTHLLAAVWHRSTSVKANAVRHASECVDFLRNVAESWPAAGHKADILQGLVIDYAEPTKSSNTQPGQMTLPSPPQQSNTHSSAIPMARSQPVQTPGDGFSGSLDWFASMIQNPEAVSGWETQM
jgi:hypothetical protein